MRKSLLNALERVRFIKTHANRFRRLKVALMIEVDRHLNVTVNSDPP